MDKNFNKIFIALTVICSGSLAHADEKKDEALNLSKVVVMGEVVHHSPSTTEMSMDDITRHRGTGNGDVFAGMAGVQTNSLRNEAGALDVGIRGIQGEGRVPIVIDGAIQSTHTFRGYQGESDRTYIDMDLISQVTVDRGATIGANSTGGIGGTVQMKTLQVADVLKSDKNYGILLRGSLYNNNQTPTIPGDSTGQERYILTDKIKQSRFNNGAFTIAGAYRNEIFDVIAAYSQRKVGNYFAGKQGAEKFVEHTARGERPPTVNPGQEVVNTSYQSRSALVKLGWNMTDEQRLELNYRQHDQKAGEVMAAYWRKYYPRKPNDSTIYAWYPPAGYEAMPQWSLGSAKVDSYRINYRYQPAHNPLIDLDVSFWLTKAKLQQRNGIASGAGSDGDQYWGSYSDDRYGFDIANTSKFREASIIANYGFNYQVQKMEPRNLFKRESARNGVRKERSVYLDVLTKNHWVDLNVATRIHKASVEDRSKYTTPGFSCHWKGACIADPSKYETRDFSYKTDWTAQANIHIYPGVDLYTKVGSVYRNPSLFEATQSFGQSFRYDEKYPLKAENTRLFEVGFLGGYSDLFTTNDALDFKINYFQNDVRNYISEAVLPGENQWSPSYSFANYSKVETRGLELGISYKNDRFFADLSATQYKDPKICPHDKTMCDVVGEQWNLITSRMAPKRTMALDLGGYFYDKKLMVGGRVKYHSGKENPKGWLNGTGVNRAVEVVPVTTTVDLYGKYSWDKDINVTWNIDNVTNRYSYDPGTVIGMPMPGRTVRVGVEVKF